jgi:hypothetical protein
MNNTLKTFFRSAADTCGASEAMLMSFKNRGAMRMNIRARVINDSVAAQCL